VSRRRSSTPRGPSDATRANGIFRQRRPPLGRTAEVTRRIDDGGAADFFDGPPANEGSGNRGTSTDVAPPALRPPGEAAGSRKTRDAGPLDHRASAFPNRGDSGGVCARSGEFRTDRSRAETSGASAELLGASSRHRPRTPPCLASDPAPRAQMTIRRLVEIGGAICQRKAPRRRRNTELPFAGRPSRTGPRVYVGEALKTPESFTEPQTRCAPYAQGSSAVRAGRGKALGFGRVFTIRFTTSTWVAIRARDRPDALADAPHRARGREKTVNGIRLGTLVPTPITFRLPGPLLASKGRPTKGRTAN